MKGYQAVAAALVELGVDTVFALPGDGNLFVDHELATVHGVRYVTAVREDGAVAMADAYAKVSGRLGVASVTMGPGLTNTLTALTTAARSRTPLLLLTGEAPSAEPDHLQRFDAAALATAAGAQLLRVDRPGHVATDVAAAVRAATTARRPTLLVVPLDLQHRDVDVTAPPVQAAPAGAGPPSEADLDRAVGVLAGARRPVLLAGAGATSPAARAAVLELAQRLGAPVATTLLAKGLFREDPADLGIIGTLATPLADSTVRSADCVVAFGASLNAYTTASGSLLADKPLVHCDVEPAALGRFSAVSAGLLGDATATASALAEKLREIEHRPGDGRGPALQSGLVEQDRQRHNALAAETQVDMRSFLFRLNRILPVDRSVTVDGGRFFPAPAHWLDVPNPCDFVWTLGFGSIGLGLAGGIGAACARGGRPSVVVLGDGGFMMSAAELSTAVRHGLDVVVVVLNDGSYGAEHHTLTAAGKDPGFSLFDWPDLAAVGTALGARAVTVRDLAGDLDEVEQAVRNRDRPLLIDVRCDPAAPMGREAADAYLRR